MKGGTPMIMRTVQTTLLLLILFCSAVAFGQTSASPANSTVLLTITGEVAHPLKLTGADLAKLPHRSVTAREHDGKEAMFDGVELGEILKMAGVKFGEELRGKDLTLYLVVEATDGYRAVFALPELDPAFTDRVVLLADKREGKALAEKEGPLRIVVAGEKRQSRWVRQVVTLKIQRAG
jgi:DMSO/TMAO reductase YedYZ molybdopterin-dependent catalytic subunit